MFMVIAFTFSLFSFKIVRVFGPVLPVHAAAAAAVVRMRKSYPHTAETKLT